MKRVTPFALLAAALLFPRSAAAQEEEESPVVALPSDWPVGTKIQLELTKEREETRGDTPVRGGSRTPVTIEVREKSPEGYVLRWTYGRARAADPEAPWNAVTERLANIVDGLALDIRTDALGMPQGLANAEAVIAFYDKVFEALGKELLEAGLPAETLEQVMRGLEPARAPGTLEVLALNDPRMFFLFCGGEYRLGETREYEDSLPNPFGGDPFPSRASFLLKEIRDEGREAVIEWRQTVEPEKAREVFLATFRTMAERMGTPPPAPEDLPEFSYADEAHFVMEVGTGWPRTVRQVRTILSGPAKRVNRTLFTRLPPSASK